MELDSNHTHILLIMTLVLWRKKMKIRVLKRHQSLEHR